MCADRPAPARFRDDLHLPYPMASGGEGVPVRITPEGAGWSYCGLDVWALGPGETRRLPTGDREYAIVPVAGGPLTVDVDGSTFQLAGRRSVFAAVTDVAYAGRDGELTISAGDEPVEVALPWALARRRIEPWYLAASEVPVEVRGAGHATRQLNNFLAPHPEGTRPGGARDADRLTCVEVLTPPGNWSSWPPHKHDDATADGSEAMLEEVYWFRLDGGDDAVGAHRTYSLAEGWDTTVTIRDRDAFLVPSGYHGPCMASPEHAMWYLNVLAGPGAQRSLAFSDDPRHAHVRAGWNDMELDPRVPMTRATEHAHG
jgi:5-deoxy-glucuronate isomerase